MRNILFALIGWVCMGPAFGQNEGPTKDPASKSDTTYWQKSFNGGVNFNQASFSNWSGGGVNSIALGAVMATRALYIKGKTSWLSTTFGLIALYNKDFSTDLQIQQTLAIGLVYNVSTFRKSN